jgi:hypothetical protein
MPSRSAKNPSIARPKKEQRDHVEQQMVEIRMHQSIGHQPVVLALAGDRRRPQDQIVHQAGVLEGHERDDAGDGDDGQGNQHERFRSR